jgi:DNA-binding NarL/FixJ family response regulator
MIKIAIIDDKPQIIRNLKEAFELFDEVEVIFTARNGEEAVQKVTTMPEKPEVIVMDIEMPKKDGIQATKEIKILFPNIFILMLTVFDDEDRIFDAILAGASGYMLKDEKPHRIINAIEDVREGRMPMSPLVATKALRYIRQKPKEKVTTKLETFELTNREIEILEHLSEGKNYQFIAEQLFISPRTVRNHISNIYRKLQVGSKGEVISMAMKNKWFE